MTAKRYSQAACRYVFCILGDWTSFDRLEKVIAEFDTGLFELDKEYSTFETDSRMSESFETSVDRVKSTFTDQDKEAVQKHKAVAYVLTPAIDNDSLLIDVAAKCLEFIGKSFREAGALAVKIESSGIAHGREGWLELHDSYIAEENEKYLYQAFVRRPISYQSGRYTCGMHLLGMPDILIPIRAFESEMNTVNELDKLAAIVLDKDGDYTKIEPIIKKQEKFNLPHAIPCTFYEEDDFFYNPFGYLYVENE